MSTTPSSRGVKRAHSENQTSEDTITLNYERSTKLVKTADISNSSAEAATLSPSPLLDLPAEIRLLIYDHMVDFTGVVVIYARHELSKEINKDSVALLHVCQLMREEVQALFYRNQTFRFCSIPAIDAFIKKIGQTFASDIRNIQITPWLGIRKDFISELPRIFQSLDGVERLTILNADHRYKEVTYQGVKNKTYVDPDPMFGGTYTSNFPVYSVVVIDRTLEILKASERLAAGKIYYFADMVQPEIQFVPSDVNFTNAQPIGTHFFSHYGAEDIVEVEMPDMTVEQAELSDIEADMSDY